MNYNFINLPKKGDEPYFAWFLCLNGRY